MCPEMRRRAERGVTPTSLAIICATHSGGAGSASRVRVLHRGCRFCIAGAVSESRVHLLPLTGSICPCQPGASSLAHRRHLHPPLGGIPGIRSARVGHDASGPSPRHPTSPKRSATWTSCRLSTGERRLLLPRVPPWRSSHGPARSDMEAGVRHSSEPGVRRGRSSRPATGFRATPLCPGRRVFHVEHRSACTNGGEGAHPGGRLPQGSPTRMSLPTSDRSTGPHLHRDHPPFLVPAAPGAHASPWGAAIPSALRTTGPHRTFEPQATTSQCFT